MKSWKIERIIAKEEKLINRKKEQERFQKQLKIFASNKKGDKLENEL